MDFSKAFDKVSRDLLSYKLDRAGIDKQTRNWIKSFSSGLLQKVVINGEEYKSVPVTSGVLLGSVLGLILFLIVIDDMAKYTKHSQILLFADDMIIYLTVSATNDWEKLHDDLKRLEKWEEDWQMEFHPAKCNVRSITRKWNRITFPCTLDGHILEEVTSAKYLGNTMTNDMTWNEHIWKTASEVNKNLGFLHRNINPRDQSLKEKAYKTVVRPTHTMEYCSMVWESYYETHSDTLEKVEKRVARWVTGRFHNMSSPSAMIQDLGWRNLNQHRADSRLCILYKLSQGLINILTILFCATTIFPVTTLYSTWALSHELYGSIKANHSSLTSMNFKYSRFHDPFKCTCNPPVISVDVHSCMLIRTL